MRVRIAYLIVVGALIGLAGCGPLSQARREPGLEFEVAMQVNSDQEFHISLGVRNAGRGGFQGDNSFNGEMEIRHMPSGELRASAQILPLESLAPNETAWPLDWHGHLEAGTYALTWGAEGYGSTTKEFAIVEKGGRLYFEGAQLVTPEAEASPGEERDVRVAPAVSDLQRRLEVEPTEFSDASLGVPEPGQVYAQVIVPGVIIRLEAKGEVYAYHGAGDRVVLVPEAAELEAPGEHVAAYQTVNVPEIDLTFEAPSAWTHVEDAPTWVAEAGTDSPLALEWDAWR